MSLVQALVTALLSGLFSGAILFALNERRDRAHLLLNKIETIVDLYSLWIDQLTKWLMDHYDIFFEGEREKARLALQELWRSAEDTQRKARLLQEIYLPGEAVAFAGVTAAYKDFLQISGNLRLASLSNQPMPQDANEHIQKAGGAIVDAGQVGKLRLYAAARRHAHAPFLVRFPLVQISKPFRKKSA